MVQFLGQENGHVFGTEKAKGVPPKSPARSHLVTNFVVPVDTSGFRQRPKYPASPKRRTKGFHPGQLAQARPQP